MYRFGLVLLTAFSLASDSSVFAQGIFSSKVEAKVHWTENASAAVKQSRESGRPMLVYVTADYCGHCRHMEKETWTNPEVVKQLNSSFVSLKLDAEQHDELVKKLGIKGLPTTLIVGVDGSYSAPITGYAGPKEILKALDKSQANAGVDNSSPVAQPR